MVDQRTEREKQEDTRTLLVELYKNSTENIKYIKTRCWWVLAVWTSFFLFLLVKPCFGYSCVENRDAFAVTIFLIGVLGAVALFFYCSYCFSDMGKHRGRLNAVTGKFKEISPDFKECYEGRPGDSLSEGASNFLGALYIAITAIIAVIVIVHPPPSASKKDSKISTDISKEVDGANEQ